MLKSFLTNLIIFGVHILSRIKLRNLTVLAGQHFLTNQDQFFVMLMAKFGQETVFLSLDAILILGYR